MLGECYLNYMLYLIACVVVVFAPAPTMTGGRRWLALSRGR
jgi:hypothetical protein